MREIHFKNSPKVLYKEGLQDVKYALSCKRIKRRKCVRMIQPVNALTPRAVFRGNGTYEGTSAKKHPNTTALINASGLAALAGGITTIVARSHTSNWLHASVVGLCGAFLALFFMTPQLIEKTNTSNLVKKNETSSLIKEDSRKFVDLMKETFKPTSKKIHFRQQA